MSLYKQLWLSIVAMMTLAFVGSFVVSNLSAKAYLEEQLYLKNLDNANSLALSLSSTQPDDPVMLGVDKFTEYGVVIKFMMQTRPDKIFPVRRQMLRRIKNRFDKEGIEISVPHRVIIQGETGETS